jgi:hypothetical protein
MQNCWQQLESDTNWPKKSFQNQFHYDGFDIYFRQNEKAARQKATFSFKGE